MIKNALMTAASLKVTAILLLLLGITVCLVYGYDLSYAWWLPVPIALLSANLLAAIVTNGRFRRQLPLLLFHVSLLSFVMLLIIGRLTYLEGRVGLTEGQVFTGQLDQYSAGPWHQYSLGNKRFENLAVEMELTPQVAVTSVKSRILLDGTEQVAGEHRPLVIDNYRFYTTRNIGFSAQILWRRHRELQGQLGSVHFPPFLGNTFNQTATWTPPQSDTELWLMLQPSQDLLKDQKPMRLSPPQNHQLIIRINDVRHSLRPGQQLVTRDGVLTYQGLRTWMGYKVHYDPTKAWLFASLFVAIGAMGWFFYGKFTKRSWQTPSTKELA